MVLYFVQKNLAFLVFVLLLSVFLYLKRKRVEVHGSFPFLYMLMYKTKLGLDKMNRWSHNKPRLFLYLAYLAFIVGVVGLFASVVLMVFQLVLIINSGIEQGGGLVIPIQTESGSIGGIPVVAPPFMEWLIALMVLVIVHEFAHGVIAQRFNVKIKSSGFAFVALILPILPAAFVEPDEKQLVKAKWWHQISVFGAGSTSNFIFGILFYLVFVFIAMPFVLSAYEVDYISFNSVMNESSLKEFGVEQGKIIEVNGKSVNDLDFFVSNVDGVAFADRVYVTEFFNFSVNESLSLTIDDGSSVSRYEINTFENPMVNGSGMIGISGVDSVLKNKTGYDFLGGFPLFFQRLVFWLVLLNIGIGIMNLLPLWITDGGQIARTLLLKNVKSKKRAYQYLNIMSFITLLMIIFTLWPNLLRVILSLF